MSIVSLGEALDTILTQTCLHLEVAVIESEAELNGTTDSQLTGQYTQCNCQETLSSTKRLWS